ncbi:MAG: beta-phosphoglucomutase [Lachnospiraceae bacterium]|nr:beta-phosphoglucomutase [Lachnospiraceae bacterium]
MKAVIFDLDGVICFTDRYHYLAWKEMADEIGVYFDETINNRLRGVSRMASLEIILEKASGEYSQKEKEALAEKKNAIYVKLLDRMSISDLSDDVKRTLEELRKRGYLLAIGSSSKNTKKILAKIGLGDFFDAISDGTNITRSKPDPEVFLKAAEMLSVTPQEALVVEDALAGIDAAVSGGFSSAGIGEAATHEKVTYRIEKLSDLLGILQGK